MTTEDVISLLVLGTFLSMAVFHSIVGSGVLRRRSTRVVVVREDER